MLTPARRIPILAALLAAVVWAGVFAPPSADAKDPCWFTQAEFDTWKHENGGDPGWGDGLGHVEAIASCVGTWHFNDSNVYYWRVWAQPDGDTVWIMFKDRYLNPDLKPRFIAKVEAGVAGPGNIWKQHFFE